jgi:hypothetical protein
MAGPEKLPIAEAMVPILFLLQSVKSVVKNSLIAA